MTITEPICPCGGRGAYGRGGTPSDPDSIVICSCPLKGNAMDPYKAALAQVESGLIAAIRARPDTFAPILVTILTQVRELLLSPADVRPEKGR